MFSFDQLRAAMAAAVPALGREGLFKGERIIARYSGSAPAYRARCSEVAARGYRELKLA